MEVFLVELPPINEDHLRKELKPLMEALGIVEYHCQGSRRKNIAWIYFSTTSDGNRFLHRHGKPPRRVEPFCSGSSGRSSRDIPAPRLVIADTIVVAKKSNRTVDQKFWDHIKLESKQKAEKAQRVDERKNSASPLSFGGSSIACGKNIFVGDNRALSFETQTSIFDFFSVKISRRALIVTSPRGFRFDILCDSIQDFIVARGKQQITLVLSEPPRFYELLGDLSTGDRFSELVNTANTPKWARETHCSKWPGHANCVAHCLVYQFQVISDDFEKLVRNWRHHDYLFITRHDLLAETLPQSLVDGYASCMKALEGKLNDPNANQGLPFPFLFQIQGLVWNNFLHPRSAYHMLTEMERIAGDCRQKATQLPFTVESMKRLRHQIPYPSAGVEADELDVFNLLKIAMDQEEALETGNVPQSESYTASLPPHQAWVMKAYVTASRILLDGPDAESKNQILRKYSNYTDYFIRCIFCDEDGQDLAFNPKVSNDRIYDRYIGVMKAGIRIAGRRFEFLGFSHSSLRSHSAWFMAPFTDDNMKKQSYATIIKGLGDFDAIRVPAKCAARIGQAFSETPFSVPVSSLGISSISIPDVKSEDESRVFSDGVGTISAEAMELFWDYLPAHIKSAAPTCFQIRWAGAKGMLALDSRLKGKVFCIRNESMRKFPSDDRAEVGICDTSSRPLCLWLNRQMIKILEDMGTEDEWFLELQRKELANLRAVMVDVAKTSAFLRKQGIGIPMGFPNFLRVLDEIGIDYRDEIFMKTVVENAVLRELRSIKHKARIFVPKGVTLFGIMDETGILKEGEIYVTFDNSQERISRPPREGRALVTRSPALHPGDIQVVKLVNPPEDSPLRDLQNCIVFSQHGERDLPSKLSGGDLDGDIYSVIWDPEAMPKRMFEPADYPRLTPKSLYRPVTRDDMAEFFVNFMKTDILGLVATRHFIEADYDKQGTLSLECLQLAGLHSTAVDSSKSGIPVRDDSLPKARRFRPDFLSPATPLKIYDIGQVSQEEEKDDDEDGDDMKPFKYRFYESQKILGKLYRSVDEKKIWKEDVEQHDKTESDDKTGSDDIWDALLSIPPIIKLKHKIDIDYKSRLSKAWKIRGMYESCVLDLMHQFSENPRTPISEVEVFCGFILSRHGRESRRQKDSSSKLREEMERTTSWIVKQMQEPKGDVAEDGVCRQKGIVELCWACLVVGCAEDSEGMDDDYVVGGLKGFKILAACCLFKQMDKVLSMNVEGVGEPISGGYVGVRGYNGEKKMSLPLRHR